MSARKEPRVLVGPLTHRIYVTHAYKELPGDIFEVTGQKWDITDQVGAALAQLDADGFELRPVPVVLDGSEQ